MNETLGLADPFLYRPVEPDFGPDDRLRALAKHELAAHAADRRIGEVPDELSHGVRVEFLPGVGEYDDLPVREADPRIEGVRLAAALRDPHEAKARERRRAALDRRGLPRGALLDDAVRPVGRAVRDDDDLELARRIALREEVLDPFPDVLLLVAGGDDHRDERLRGGGGLGDGARPHPRPHPEDERISRVRVEDEDEREPEQGFHRRPDDR